MRVPKPSGRASGRVERALLALLPPMWRPPALVLAASGVLASSFVFIVPPGVPYDEPSHWANVVYYLTEQRMPRLGEPGVSYEAQMGPVAYVLDALVAAPLWPVSHEAAFYAVRAFGAVQHLLLTVLIWRLAGRVLGGSPNGPLLAALCVGLNPMLLTMSTSVQNDTLSLLLAVLALDVATAHPPTFVRAASMGLIAGAALLTKITVWPIVLVLGLWLLLRRRWGQTVLYGVTAVAVSGWWFVRNQVLYGDLTARAGVAAAGYDFPPLGEVQPFSLARSAITYLWLPTEYVRNLIESPPIMDGLVVLLTAVGVLGLLYLATGKVHAGGPLLGLLGASAILAVSGWLVTATTTQSVAFRFAYAALPLWFVAVGSLARVPRMRWIVPVVTAVLVVVDAWFLHALTQLPPQAFGLEW